MATTKGKGNDVAVQETSVSSIDVPSRRPRSLGIATGGIRTSREFAQLMSALMTDVIDGSLTPEISNAAVNAGGKLLKVVELQMKYGSTLPGQQHKSLTLCDESPPLAIAKTSESIKQEFAAMREELDKREKEILAECA